MFQTLAGAVVGPGVGKCSEYTPLLLLLLVLQAKQEPNEFIVLNARAYHAGYNMGFNCAEVRVCVCENCEGAVRVLLGFGEGFGVQQCA
jgi:hypothetical protein